MHAATIKVSDYLTLEQIRQLRGRSDLVGRPTSDGGTGSAAP